jgi:hypothetical protein
MKKSGAFALAAAVIREASAVLRRLSAALTSKPTPKHERRGSLSRPRGEVGWDIGPPRA